MKIKHLEENNISYLKHMKRALSYSFNSLLAFSFFLVHAFLPFLFVKSGSNTIKKIYNEVK